MPLKLIPINEDQRKRLKDFLDSEISAAEQGREALLRRVRTWRRNYLSEPEEPIKNFPWPKCSNVVNPITPTHTDAIHARIKNTVLAFEKVWAMREATAEGGSFVEALEHYYSYLQDNELKFDDYGSQVILQAVKLGTCTAKCMYSVENRLDKRYDTAGKIVQSTKNIKDGFELSAIDFEDFIVPIDARDPQTARWVDHRHRLTWGGLKWREFNGIYEKGILERIKLFYNNFASASKEEHERLQGLSRQMPNTRPEYSTHDLEELWMYYDIDDDGFDEHIVVTYHILSGEIMRVVFNWYDSGKRPFFRFRYWEQEDSYYGIGVCQMLEQTQKEIDMIHNQRNDNASIANMKAFKARIGSGIKQGTRIYPGKIFLMNNMDDMQEFALGEIYPSSYNNEIVSRDYGERRTSINDFNLGVEAKAIRRTPAATTMAVIQESNKRFDLVIRDTRATLRELGSWILEVTHQIKPTDKLNRVLGAKHGAVMAQLLALPVEKIKQCVIVDISATSAALNKEMETQKILQVFQMTTQYFTALSPIAQAIASGQLPPQLVLFYAKMGEVGDALVSRAMKLNDLMALADKLPTIMEMLSVPNGGVQPNPGLEGGAGQIQGAPGLLSPAGAGGGPEGGFGGGY